MKGVAHCGYVMTAELIVCLTIVSQQDCELRRFDLFTAILHQATVSTCYVSVYVAPWLAMLGAFNEV